MPEPAEISAALRLSCRPNKTAESLIFPYAIENNGRRDVFVMDAVQSFDTASRQARGNDQASVVMLGADDNVVIGKVIAPLPTDRLIAVPLVPLARRLPAGGTLQAQLAVPLPLAEASPYFADLPLRGYDMVDVRTVTFTIGYWLSDVDNLVSMPADHAPDLSVVVTRNTVRSARYVTQLFPTNGLRIFKRKDRFPRSLG